jgi:hypothetical protein
MKFRLSAVLLICVSTTLCHAGGPILVGGPAAGNRPAFGKDGQPFIWNPAAMPIRYGVDPGPMAVTSTGTEVISNSAGLARVAAMFEPWHSVTTASISFSYAGPLLPAGSYTKGDLATVEQFDDVLGSCRSGTQNPIVFDANGGLMSDLGLPANEVIGFTQPCGVDTASGYITGSAIVLNGRLQDGIDTPNTPTPNVELTANQFDQAITHEIGHLIGLDHSQINLDMFLSNPNVPCDADSMAGRPVIFPVLVCSARKDVGLPALSPDDVAWVSTLYPNPSFSSGFLRRQRQSRATTIITNWSRWAAAQCILRRSPGEIFRTTRWIQ